MSKINVTKMTMQKISVEANNKLKELSANCGLEMRTLLSELVHTAYLEMLSDKEKDAATAASELFDWDNVNGKTQTPNPNPAIELILNSPNPTMTAVDICVEIARKDHAMLSDTSHLIAVERLRDALPG